MDTKIKAKVTSRKILNDFPRPASPATRLTTQQQQQLSSSSTPPIRPRAKVNSSANFTSARKAPATTSAVVVYAPNRFSVSDPPSRPASPFKVISQPRSAQPSPIVANFRAKVSVPVRPSSALSFVSPTSAPNSRQQQQRVFTAANSRDRRGSTSSTLTAPPCPSITRATTAPLPSPPTSWPSHVPGTSPPPPLPPSAPPPTGGNYQPNNSPPPSIVGPGGRAVVRVKSKVSRLADIHHPSASAPPTPSLPSLPSHPAQNKVRNGTGGTKPARVASISNLRLRTGLQAGGVSAPNSPFSGSLSPTSPSAGSTTINNPAGKPRFATTRQAPSTQKQPQHQRIPSYQPFVADDLDVTYHSNNSLNTNTLNATSVNGIAKNSTNSNNGSISTHPYIPSLTAKVDPAMIALPPQSPPTSTLSFSSSASRSSLSFDTLGSSGVSRASGGTAPTYSSSKVNGYSNPNSTLSGGSGGLSPHIIHPQQIVNGVNGSRRSLDGLGIRNGGRSRQSSPSSSGSLEEDGEVINLEDRRVKAEAKSNRKIADLEITNRSLLAINSTLEATKHRQAKEIRDLRRRLRESRLILPPPAYRAVKSSLHKSSHPDDPNATNASSDSNSEDEDDDEDEGEDESVWEGRLDETYNRVKGMMEVLLEQGQKALEAKPEELLGTGKGGTRVLSEEEARTWRGEVDVDGNASSGLMSLRRHDEDDNVDDDEDEEGRGKKPKMLSTSSRILVLNTLNNRPPLSPSEDTSFTEEDRSLSRLDVDSEEEEGESFIEDDLDLVPPIRVTHSS